MQRNERLLRTDPYLVLDALAVAKVDNVTFTVNEEE